MSDHYVQAFFLSPASASGSSTPTSTAERCVDPDGQKTYRVRHELIDEFSEFA
jgi:hypothetical protein